MKPDVAAAAIDHAQADAPENRERWPVIYLSPRGRPLTQARVRELAAGAGLTLLCGRFEGVDQRVLEARRVEEVSIGDFVLTGGEIPAMALIDAVIRLQPGVVGNEASVVEESFSRGLLEHPHYTRPQVWEGRAIPEISPLRPSREDRKVATLPGDKADKGTSSRPLGGPIPPGWRGQPMETESSRTRQPPPLKAGRPRTERNEPCCNSSRPSISRNWARPSPISPPATPSASASR